MKTLLFPYGRQALPHTFTDSELAGVLTPAHSLDEALAVAKALLGKPDPIITAIPDGVAVVVTK